MRPARFFATQTRARRLGDGPWSGLPTARLISIDATSAHNIGAHNIGTDKPTEVGRSNEIDDAQLFGGANGGGRHAFAESSP